SEAAAPQETSPRQSAVRKNAGVYRVQASGRLVKDDGCGRLPKQDVNLRVTARMERRTALGAIVAAALVCAARPAGQPGAPAFELASPDLCGAPGGQQNAWADFDNDGRLDEFVGFRGRPNRLYRQQNGRFTDVAADVGVADNVETRVAAWGDFDGDGNIDLY